MENKLEPVAYINVEERKLEWAHPMKWETPTVVKMDKVPLYTAPPQRKEWVGLTDEEMSKAYNVNYNIYKEHIEYVDFVLIYRAIEAKLKEKNGG